MVYLIYLSQNNAKIRKLSTYATLIEAVTAEAYGVRGLTPLHKLVFHV